MAPHLRSYGVPHPIEYLVSLLGTVLSKYFVSNYMHRVAGSSVALREFSALAGDAPVATFKSGALTVSIGFPAKRVFSGQELSFSTRLAVEQGWHIYGTPLASCYTPIAISFDPHILRHGFRLHPAKTVAIPLLGEIVPVYSGAIEGSETLLLNHPLPEGTVVFKGRIDAQQCSDTACGTAAQYVLRDRPDT